jgi:hypothetical protein
VVADQKSGTFYFFANCKIGEKTVSQTSQLGVDSDKNWVWKGV